MPGRLCSKVACGADAVATLTYDYADAMAVLGPLTIVGKTVVLVALVVSVEAAWPVFDEAEQSSLFLRWFTPLVLADVAVTAIAKALW